MKEEKHTPQLEKEYKPEEKYNPEEDKKRLERLYRENREIENDIYHYEYEKKNKTNENLEMLKILKERKEKVIKEIEKIETNPNFVNSIKKEIKEKLPSIEEDVIFEKAKFYINCLKKASLYEKIVSGLEETIHRISKNYKITEDDVERLDKILKSLEPFNDRRNNEYHIQNGYFDQEIERNEKTYNYIYNIKYKINQYKVSDIKKTEDYYNEEIKKKEESISEIYAEKEKLKNREDKLKDSLLFKLPLLSGIKKEELKTINKLNKGYDELIKTYDRQIEGMKGKINRAIYEAYEKSRWASDSLATYRDRIWSEIKGTVNSLYNYLKKSSIDDIRFLFDKNLIEKCNLPERTYYNIVSSQKETGDEIKKRIEGFKEIIENNKDNALPIIRELFPYLDIREYTQEDKWLGNLEGKLSVTTKEGVRKKGYIEINPREIPPMSSERLKLLI